MKNQIPVTRNPNSNTLFGGGLWDYRPHRPIGPTRELDEIFNLMIHHMFTITKLNDKLILSTDIPGVKKENVDLQIEGSVLLLKCKRSDKDTNTLIERTYEIDSKIDQSTITAALEDGVLTIELPFAASTLPRKIALK